MQPQKTLLLADDDQAFLLALTLRCQDLGVAVKTAANGLEALVMLRQMITAGDAPDLLILDINMPGADGLNVCEKLGQNATTSGIPVIILTGRSDEETLNYCKFLGAHYVRKSLEFWEKLGPVICKRLDIDTALANQPDAEHKVSLEAPAEPSVPTVLVIDDDPEITKAFTIRLGALGIEVIKAPNAEQGAFFAKTECPDLIITDHYMPNMSGEHLVVKLKGDEDTKNIPVIVITGQTLDGREDLSLKREMLGRRGAAAYFTKPVDFNALLEELKLHIWIPANRSGSPVPGAR